MTVFFTHEDAAIQNAERHGTFELLVDREGRGHVDVGGCQFNLARRTRLARCDGEVSLGCLACCVESEDSDGQVIGSWLAQTAMLACRATAVTSESYL